jgi:hypothetical protein
MVALVNMRFVISVGASLLFATAVYSGEYQHTKDGKTLVWNNNPKPEDVADWSGKTDKAGYATGYGTLVWYRVERAIRTGSSIPADKRMPISSYSGKMVKGKLNGPVVAADANGKIFHGTFVDGRRTRDWAAGPSRHVRRGQLVEAPAEAPTTAKSENVQTPTLTIQPETPEPPAEGPPKTDASGSPKQVSDSLRSLTAPPASLRTDVAAEASPPASIPSTGSPPPAAASAGFDAVQAIALADAEARQRGYDLGEYERPQVRYMTEDETWSVSYDQKGVNGTGETGKHFSVTVDDKTKKAELKK